MNWLPIVNEVPALCFSPLYPPIPTEAAPEMLIEPALAADTETSDAAKAVRPIFFMFILITPLINCCYY